jgi:hypothetical protein
MHPDLYYIVHRMESKLTLGIELAVVGCIPKTLELVELSCVPETMMLG